MARSPTTTSSRCRTRSSSRGAAFPAHPRSVADFRRCQTRAWIAPEEGGVVGEATEVELSTTSVKTADFTESPVPGWEECLPSRATQVLYQTASVIVDPSRLAQMAARDFPVQAALWLLRHATRPTLTALLRSFGTYTRHDASEVAAKIAAVPDRTAWLEATLAASLGVARRRQGLKNDFTGTGTPAPLERIGSRP